MRRYRGKGILGWDRENASLAAFFSNFATFPISKLMNTCRIAFTLAALLLAAMPVAHAGSSARIVETHPSAGATLGRNESFYVRVEYAADEPISLWARPYRDRGIRRVAHPHRYSG